MRNILKLSLIMAFLSLPLFAKEPTNTMIGFGIGTGQTKLSMEHSRAMLDPPYNGPNSTTPRWNKHTNRYLSSWALAWEFLVGYKHFINDWVGFRYYGNVGVQHYQAKSLGDKSQKIGIIDYTLNADLLINFWENDLMSIGMLGGLGFGGTSFDKKAITRYMAIYSANNPNVPVGLADVQKHFLNVNASVGFRLTIFQKYRRTSAKVCDKFVEGKRVCRVPVFFIGHGIEFNAKFPLLDYRATAQPDIYTLPGANLTTGQGIISRPAYTVGNPYRLTVRYIVDF